MAEEAVDPGRAGKLGQVPVLRHVEIAHVEESRRQGSAAEIGRFLEQEEACEVHFGERAQVDDRPVGDSVAHRCQDLSEALCLAGPDVGDDRQ